MLCEHIALWSAGLHACLVVPCMLGDGMLQPVVRLSFSGMHLNQCACVPAALAPGSKLAGPGSSAAHCSVGNPGMLPHLPMMTFCQQLLGASQR